MMARVVVLSVSITNNNAAVPSCYFSGYCCGKQFSPVLQVPDGDFPEKKP
jgi:hypothetical protein